MLTRIQLRTVTTEQSERDYAGLSIQYDDQHMKYNGVIPLICISAALGACDGNSTATCNADQESATFSLAPNSTTSLVMQGVIDCTTNDKLQAKLKDNPIDTLIMSDVPGSADDDANIAMAKIVSGQSLTTVVPANGLIASGGVDLFLAGANRRIEANAVVGVHSWATGDGTQGIDVYNRDPGNKNHRRYIDFYDQYVQGMKDGRPSNSISDVATDFYVYTLQAAPAEGVHCMTPQEIVDWGVVTNTSDPSTLSTKTLGQSAVCSH